MSSSWAGYRNMTSADDLNWTVCSSPTDLGRRWLCWQLPPQLSQFVAMSNSGTRHWVMVSP
jgi:hypothetical protein